MVTISMRGHCCRNDVVIRTQIVRAITIIITIINSGMLAVYSQLS